MVSGGRRLASAAREMAGRQDGGDQTNGEESQQTAA